jgi:hypothetical protein
MSSPLRGADGNVEFVVWARAHTTGGLTPESAADAALETLPASQDPVVVSEGPGRGSPGQDVP